jgi:hypothetical protein
MDATLGGAIRAAIIGLFLVVSGSAAAGSIPAEVWLEFGFTDVGVDATGCDPDDPLGPFCIPSSGTPTAFLDAPPWTFSGGALLTVVDAFEAGDQFEVFDFGASLGATSLPVGSADCGDDPVPCVADPNVSHGVFVLPGGAHAVTIKPLLAPSGGGSGYLILQAEVPEPPPWLALFAGLVALIAARYRAARNHREQRP